MELLIKELLEDKKAIKELKNIAIEFKKYELASKIREIELTKFPETEEIKNIKRRVNELSLLFRMFDLDIRDKLIYIIDEAMKLFKNKKGNTSLKDTIEIKRKAEGLF